MVSHCGSEEPKNHDVRNYQILGGYLLNEMKLCT